MKFTCVLGDSHPQMLEGIRSLLQTEFDSVVMVADERSLVRAIESLRPELVVVDLSFPVSEERDLLSLLAKRTAGPKFILLSVHDEPEVIRSCMARGASGFVLKRLAGRDLLLAVDAVKRGETFVSPS